MQALPLELGLRLEQTSLRAVEHTAMMQMVMQSQQGKKQLVAHWRHSRNRCCLCTVARKLRLRR